VVIAELQEVNSDFTSEPQSLPHILHQR